MWYNTIWKIWVLLTLKLDSTLEESAPTAAPTFKTIKCWVVEFKNEPVRPANMNIAVVDQMRWPTPEINRLHKSVLNDRLLKMHEVEEVWWAFRKVQYIIECMVSPGYITY